MKLYNTLTRSLEEFRPLQPPTVTIYVCGPTVYDDPHIGHARSAYTFDVLRRYLAYKKYDVTFVRNVTDVDDKIIEKARQEVAKSPGHQVTRDLNAACREVSEKYLKSYHATMDRLGIGRPDKEPRATEHVVPDMTDFISKLLISGNAYEAKGDVYFSVRKFPGYGKLSNRTLDDLQAGARVEPGEQKQDPLDFALWKTAKPGEPSWKSPWGDGRPGWHIECSVMSTKYLGEAFDIHGGGLDLIFPHHENEMAQAQALDKPFAKYWVHNGLLTVKGEKMSKSLGNFITVDHALMEARKNPGALKVFFLGAHYRSPIDYSPEAIKAALKRFENLVNGFNVGRHYDEKDFEMPNSVPEVEKLKQEFSEAMDNDMNTPQALAVLDKLSNQIHRWLIDIGTKKPGESVRSLGGKMRVASDTISYLAKEVFGLSALELSEPGQDAKRLFAEYEKARSQKNFAVSDQKRKELLEQGFKVQDTTHGSMLIPAL